MKGCPSERALARAFAGLGSASTEVHLRTCATCVERHARIERDVALLQRTLLEPRPREPSRATVRPRSLVSLAAAAAVAAGVVLALRLLGAPSGVERSAAAPPGDAEVRAAVHEVSSALFLVGEPGSERLVPRRPSSTAIVEAALAGG
jgi:hypothetical protein